MNKIIIDRYNYSKEKYLALIEYLNNSSSEYTLLKLDYDKFNLEEIKDIFYEIISLAEDIINQMPEKGLKCSDCQRMCLKQTLNDFESVVNGISSSDLIE